MLNKKHITVLHINLSTGKSTVQKRTDLTKYLGGVGVASKLLEEYMQPGKDPLHEDQPIILAIGALSTVFPVITKTVAMFISPVTGELGESYAGGRLAFTMFNAGIDALIITGKSEKPSYLSIFNKNFDIKSATSFWGVNAAKTGDYIRTYEGGQGKRSIIRIGPAGENECSFANVNVDTFRHFGRMGLGAVFGSKKLKAIQIQGDQVEKIENFPKYFKVYTELYKKITETPVMSKYHDLGTPINVKVLNNIGAMPTRNLKTASFEGFENISGEHFAENNLVGKLACVGCPVGCIHIGQVRRQFDDGYDYETLDVAYDYELISAMGSLIGVDDANSVLELIDSTEEAGVDTISAGICLSWATEALEKGVVTLEDTIVDLKFGDKVAYLEAMEHLTKQTNEFYSHLAKGVYHVSKVYGGEDFAVHIAKNEMPQYHTGYASVVGYSCGARHSHLCNGGYSYDQSHRELDKEQTVNDLFKEEIGRCLSNALTICLFARNVYDMDTTIKAFDAIGVTYTAEELNEVAKEIYKTKLRIKQALGFDLSDVKIPKRILETPAMNTKLDEDTIYEMIQMFKAKNEELLNS